MDKHDPRGREMKRDVDEATKMFYNNVFSRNLFKLRHLKMVPQDIFPPVEVLSWLSKDTQFKVLMHQLRYNQGDLRFFQIEEKTFTIFISRAWASETLLRQCSGRNPEKLLRERSSKHFRNHKLLFWSFSGNKQNDFNGQTRSTG